MTNEQRHTDLSTDWVLAALPPLLFGLVLSLLVAVLVPLRSVVWGAATPLPRPVVGQTVWLPAAMLGLLLVVLIGGALVGLWRRCAAWSHTWSTAAVVSVAMALSIMADDVPYLISPFVDVLIMVALVLALAAVTLVAARRSMTEAALVALGFVSIFSLVAVFSAVASPMLRMDIALIMAPAGLAFAALITAFLRWQSGARWIVLALTAVLAGALIWTYAVGVASALSADIALKFVRVLGVIAAVGFLAPLALGWLLSLRRRPALGTA